MITSMLCIEFRRCFEDSWKSKSLAWTLVHCVMHKGTYIRTYISIYSCHHAYHALLTCRKRYTRTREEERKRKELEEQLDKLRQDAWVAEVNLERRKAAEEARVRHLITQSILRCF